MTLQGHGVRYRTQAGPGQLDGEPFDDVVLVRRYRCRDCSAVVTVMPMGLLPRVRYRPVAIVIGLALWAAGVASAAVRRQVSPAPTRAAEASRGWASLGRWARRGFSWWKLRPTGRGTRGRDSVEALLQRLAGRAQEPGRDLVAAAIQAVSLFKGHGLCAPEELAPTT